MASTDPTWCPPLLFLAQSFFLAGEDPMDGATFCLVKAITGTKFSMLQSFTFLFFDNLGVSPYGHDKYNQVHCIVFPTIALMLDLPPSPPKEKRQAP